jgi:glycosyltransferase involved in cell wall biosynthesis
MISVIVPTYNRKQLLPRALESVLRQTYQDFEIIVIDDGSTDGTEELFAARYTDARIRYERLPQNQGVHKARNHGLDIARGEFVAFLDSDDELYPHALERALAALNNTEFGVVLSSYRLDNGELTGFDRQEDGEITFADLLCSRRTRKVKATFTMIRRSVIGDIRWKVQYLQFTFFRMVESKTRSWYIAEPLAIYHRGADAHSITKVRNVTNTRLSIERARVLSEFIELFGAQLIAGCPHMYGYYAYGASVGLLLDGQTQKARVLAREAARYQPNPRYRFFRFFSLLPFSPALLRASFALKRALVR